MISYIQILLVEVKAIINACPFIYIQDNVDGVSYTLSPSHLIYGWQMADQMTVILTSLVHMQHLPS